MEVRNKEYIIKRLKECTLLTKKETEIVVDSLLSIILDEIKHGNEIHLVGFGKFYPYKHSARPVRNPQTLEDMTLDEYTSMRFKSSEVIKELLKVRYSIEQSMESDNNEPIE